MTSREQPWHLRRLSHEHTQWFRNLHALHQFNQALDPHAPRRELKLTLDETRPEDVLGRMESQLWEEHAAAWSKIKRKDDFAAICRAEGEKFAEATWLNAGKKGAPGRTNLQEAYAAMSSSPFAGYPATHPSLSGFLLKRLVASELTARLRRCPHTSSIEAIRLDADRICRGQALWYEGMLKRLNPSIVLELERPDRACELRLTYSV